MPLTSRISPKPWTFENDWGGCIRIKDAEGKTVATLEKHAVQQQGVSATAHAELQNRNAQLIVDLVNASAEG